MAVALTPRQEQVVELLSQGLTNKEIADALGIGPEGVKAHISRLLLRFGVRNRVALLHALRRSSEERHDSFARASRSLGAIGAGLAGNGHAQDGGGMALRLAELRAYEGRLDQVMDRVGTYGSADALRRLGSLRESLGAIALAVEIASLGGPAGTDRMLLEAIRARSATALNAVVELDEILSAESLPKRHAPRPPRRSATPRARTSHAPRAVSRAR